MLLLGLFNPLQADEKYTELKQNEPAPYAGILLTKEAIAKIYTAHEAEIAKLKVNHDYDVNRQSLDAKLKYDLLDKRYKLDVDMYKVMIENRNGAIKNMSRNKPSIGAEWSMIGGFILGAATTVGVVYSIDKIIQ